MAGRCRDAANEIMRYNRHPGIGEDWGGGKEWNMGTAKTATLISNERLSMCKFD